MGLMIYDNLDGPFELRLASVAAYSAPAPFALNQFRWKNRVLVVSAPARDDANLLKLQDDLASMPAEFEDRDMLLVTLLDTGASIAGERTIDAADADATRTSLGVSTDSFALRLIGKDGSVKLSADAAVPMTEIFALIDTMPMRQGEIADR